MALREYYNEIREKQQEVVVMEKKLTIDKEMKELWPAVRVECL